MPTQRMTKERRDLLSLGSRVHHFYKQFNEQNWERCYSYLDPTLRDASSSRSRESWGTAQDSDAWGGDCCKVALEPYAESLNAFFEAYGPIQELKIVNQSIHPGMMTGNDRRDFACLVISWKDRMNIYHHFRERWVKVTSKPKTATWFSRMVGLVPPAADSGPHA